MSDFSAENNTFEPNKENQYSSENKTEKFFCKNPFTCCEVIKSGEIYSCCSFHIKTCLGNFFEKNFEEIWNSEDAINIRKSILDQSYSYCNTDRCPSFNVPEQQLSIEEYNIAIKSNGYMEKGPNHVTFTYDRECNVACIFCRDEVTRHTDEELEFYSTLFEKKFLPMLKDTKTVTINAHGDAFASRHSRYAIKRIHETYPDIKFEIFTNGILFNEYSLKELGIEKNICSIKISVHATTKKTYSKIIKNGELYWDSLMKNLNFASSLRKKYGIDFHLLFVVTSLNYKEMPDFVKMAGQLDAIPTFSEYIESQNCRKQDHSEYIIANKFHRDYKKLIKVLNHPNMFYSTASQIIGISPLLLKIQAEKKSFKQMLNEQIKYIQNIFATILPYFD